MDDGWVLLVTCAATVFGAVLQRVTGMGFGSVMAPVLVVAVGPVAGVQWTNVLSAAASVFILVAIWRKVDLRRTALIAVAAVATTPLGVGLVLVLPKPMLEILIGIVMLAAVVSVAPIRRIPFIARPVGAIATGAVSGLANASAGLAGPLLSAYALATRWEMTSYVASMQLCWVLVNTVAVAIKGMPAVSWSSALILLGALVAGSLVGLLVSSRVPARVSRMVLVFVALTGSALMLVRGVLAL